MMRHQTWNHLERLFCPEKRGLGDDFPLGKIYFQGQAVSFTEELYIMHLNYILNHLNHNSLCIIINHTVNILIDCMQ